RLGSKGQIVPLTSQASASGGPGGTNRTVGLERVEPHLRRARPRRVTAGEQLERSPARPTRRQKLGGQVRIEKRELPPGVDEERLHPEEGLARRWPNRSEVIDERLVLRAHRTQVPRRSGHIRTLPEHP